MAEMVNMTSVTSISFNRLIVVLFAVFPQVVDHKSDEANK